jgi:hypothetical protein
MTEKTPVKHPRPNQTGRSAEHMAKMRAARTDEQCRAGGLDPERLAELRARIIPGVNDGHRKRAIPDTAENREVFEGLGRLHATIEEVAAFFRVDASTVHSSFKSDPELRVSYETGKSTGKESLRRAQLNAALNGNPALLIWLGKAILGQREDVTINVDAKYVVGIRREMFESDDEFEREYIDVSPEKPKKLNGNGASKLS